MLNKEQIVEQLIGMREKILATKLNDISIDSFAEIYIENLELIISDIEKEILLFNNRE